MMILANAELILPDRVMRAAHRASPDIYGDDLAQLNLRVMAQLKRLAGTSAHLAPYIGNGHAGWEAAAINMFAPGDRALVLTSGHFGRSWAELLTQLGVEVERLDFGKKIPLLVNNSTGVMLNSSREQGGFMRGSGCEEVVSMVDHQLVLCTSVLRAA